MGVRVKVLYFASAKECTGGVAEEAVLVDGSEGAPATTKELFQMLVRTSVSRQTCTSDRRGAWRKSDLTRPTDSHRIDAAGQASRVTLHREHPRPGREHGLRREGAASVGIDDTTPAPLPLPLSAHTAQRIGRADTPDDELLGMHEPDEDVALKDNDEVAVIPPIGGG